ncbi:MAG: iron ABC transporter permease [Acidimicrobiia bacterium]|nr:MAG: iron ABC transporter permease [Acidimicrobiia bacterium]
MDPRVDNDRTLVNHRYIGRFGIWAVISLPVIFLGYFFIYPVISITIRGLTVDGSFSLDSFSVVMRDPTLQGVARFTLFQALLSTILTVAVALPAAWVFARFSFRGKRLLQAASLVPFVLPTLVVGSAFLTLAGPRGVLGVDLTGTLWLIVLAHVFYNYAIVVRGVSAFWERIDPRLEAAARTLGASPWKAFRTVTLPILRPAIASTSALVFLFSFTSFGVVLLLGDLRSTTLEVEIWRQTTAFLRLDIASTLAVLQLVGISLILVVYGWLQRRTSVQFSYTVNEAPEPHTARERWTMRAVVGSMIVILGTPLAVLFGRSFTEPSGGFGLANYQNLFTLPSISAAFVDPLIAIRNSLLFAFVAAGIGLLIGVLSAIALTYAGRVTSRTLDLFVMLPLGTSAVTIGFGFLVALDWPLDLRTSIILIPIAHALVAIPFVVRTTSPAIAAVQSELREAAATLGAGRWRTWWTIDARLVGAALIVAAAFAFAISMGEFGATTFIARPNTPTIPIAIFRLLGRPGPTPFGAAIALSAILAVVTGAAMLIIDSLGRKRIRSEL